MIYSTKKSCLGITLIEALVTIISFIFWRKYHSYTISYQTLLGRLKKYGLKRRNRGGLLSQILLDAIRRKIHSRINVPGSAWPFFFWRDFLFGVSFFLLPGVLFSFLVSFLFSFSVAVMGHRKFRKYLSKVLFFRNSICTLSITIFYLFSCIIIVY